MRRQLSEWIMSLLVGGLFLLACSQKGEIRSLSLDEPLPLDSYVTSQDSSSRHSDFVRYHELVASCMEEQGFVYFIPELEDSERDRDVMEFKPEELLSYADSHGYSLSEFLLSGGTGYTAIEYELVPSWAIPDDEYQLAIGALNDPEERYFSSLSPSEMEAYWLALDGLEDPDIPEDEWVVGCVGIAEDLSNQTKTDAPEWLDEAYGLINEYYERAETDRAAAEQLWVDCMESKGFSGFDERIDAPESIRARIEEMWNQLPSLDAPFPEDQVEELYSHELDLARADAACSVEVYMPALHAIDYEAQHEALVELGVISE